MDFEPTEEQRLFHDAIERFLEGAYDFATRGRILAEPAGYRAAHWRHFAEQGMLALLVPEACGGLGGSVADVQVMMAAIGRHLVVSPYFASAVVATAAISAAGSDEQKGLLLPALAQGRLIATLAHGEPEGRFDPGHVATRAARAGAAVTLKGRKAVVPFAAEADKIIVSAREAGAAADPAGISLFLLDTGTPGLDLVRYRTIDGGSAADLILNDVHISEQDRLGAAGEAYGVVRLVWHVARAALIAEACGAMWAIYERTLDYLKTREQFGQPLGRFQALQHRMVDVYMKCEAARSARIDAAWALDHGPANEADQRIGGLKYLVGRDLRHVAQEGIQLHGAMGMMREMPLGAYYARATMIDATFGDTESTLADYRRRMVATEAAR